MYTAKARKMGYDIAGPVFVEYVSWILKDAMDNNITTLYFLARDGYALKKIADILCKRYGIDIECRYLYCSRLALRIPSFHILDDEAYNLLCISGYHVTLRTVLERMSISGTLADDIIGELGIQPDVVLGKDELSRLREQLKACSAFSEAAYRISSEAYGLIIDYFHQEGLFDKSCVAIVDSGWTGSMQRSIRQLLQSDGFKGEIRGYYFGLYPVLKDRLDGVYKTWYFSGRGNVLDKILFCNNLLECMLTAPHGMTTGFKKRDGQIVPFFSAQEKGLAEFANEHISGLLEYAENANVQFSDCCSKKMRRFIHRFMARPTLEEVECYGQIPFCDDLNEQRKIVLAGREQISYLKDYLVFRRIYAKLSKNVAAHASLYWPYGTLVFVNPARRAWYRLNMFVGDWIKYIQKR